MGMITITCPRCKEDFATDEDRGTASCPSCGCRLLLKKRTQEQSNLDPAATTPGISDALSQQHSFVGEKPDALADGAALLRQGDQLLQRNQYNQALYVFRHAAQATPQDYRAWWGVTTATLQHLRAYLENQKMALNITPLEQVYARQCASAQRAMTRTRALAAAEYLPMLEDAYTYERHAAAKALRTARRVCRRNLRRHRNFSLRLALFFIAMLLLASGVVCFLSLPLELPGKLLIGSAACIVGLLSAVFALRI